MGNSSSIDVEAKYHITVETSKGYVGQGGKSIRVYIDLTGDNGKKTGWIDLSEVNDDASFGPGEVDEFNITAEDVGLPIIVRIGLRDHALKDPWAVRHVLIKYGEEKAFFPVNDWIQNEMWVTRGEGLLYHQVDNPYIRSMLDREVELSRALLPWSPRPGSTELSRGLPRFVNPASMEDEIPLIFRPTEIWEHTFGMNFVGNVKNFAFDVVAGWLHGLHGFDSYEYLVKHFDKNDEGTPIFKRWKSDEEFGRQQLNGISPTSMERCTKITDSCKISDKHVAELLEGRTLKKAMEAGKIYISDYSEVYKGVKRNKDFSGNQLYCPEAICLFHVNSDDNLVPIAIQLEPDDRRTIFTPKDSEHDWLLAKMYFRVAFGNMHEWHYHFLLTHGVMEPFAVALFRGLPRSHPIYKLLRPHLQTVTVINSLARKTLIAAGTLPNKSLAIEGEDLSRHTFKSFTMKDLVLPDVLKAKGLDDKKLLPKFYFRDDAMELWKIMEEFVSDIVGHFYHIDRDVIDDEHFQEFVKDVAEQGLGWEDETTRGIPVPMKCVQQMVRFCTTVMFTSSVQHAAVNFPQHEKYKFIPNGPLAMRLPPHKKGEADMERILDSLPDVKMSVFVMALTAQLSSYTSDEVFIGNYPVKLFVEPETQKAIEKYKASIDEYAKRVKKRNADVKYPYIWLLPKKVPNSIAI